MQKNFKIILISIIFLILPLFVSADYLGQKVDFFVDPSYDFYSQSQISAVLKRIFTNLYFYVDEGWWNSLKIEKQNEINLAFNQLAAEFDNKIYPTLTSTFGSMPEPGIDRDEKITILIHPMKKDAGGYFNTGDVYFKLQYPRSNQREMVYLNSQHIDKPEAKSLLAHEFMHLITVNQQDLLRGISEETWLNEARAEYGPTLLGYDTEYKGSNLETRVKAFLEKPSDSLTEWLNQKSDYGIANLFIQYLVDHYGIKILADSLQSSKTGILSLNYALLKNSFKEDFSQIFTDFLITVLVNDCNLGSKYCYSNSNLKNLKVVPLIHFLPFSREGVLLVNYTTKEWAGNWQKIIGGKGTLTLEFDGQDGVDFKVPYLICDYQEKCQIDFLTLDKDQKGKITISEFNTKYISLTIFPSIQSKISGFNSLEPTYLFSWEVSITEKAEAELIKELLAQIEFLQKEIAKVQAQINVILAKRGQKISCQKFGNNLYYGMTGSSEVRCLQEFLKNQGPEIYPEGLITGNFLSLTQAAVIRFQKKYAGEILKPLDLEKGTGFFGAKTRAKINQLLGY